VVPTDPKGESRARRSNLVSIVVPAYNEADGLSHFAETLGDVLRPLEGRWRFEVVFVDDGSQDQTPEVAGGLCRSDSRFRYLRLSRNFGHQAALTAGLEHARGACVVSLDADLQHPPSLLPALLAAWEGGADVVDARRRETEGIGWFKRATSDLFYRIVPVLTGLPIGQGGSDFRLLDRRVVDVLIRLPEKRRFYRGLVPWLGFARSTIDFEAGARFAGRTKYSLRKMLRLASDGVFGFTNLPLRIAFLAGGTGMLLGAVYMTWAVYERVVRHTTLTGWTSLLLTTIFFGSLNLFVLGILGEYLGRVHEQTKGRPTYVLDEERSLPGVEEKAEP